MGRARCILLSLAAVAAAEPGSAATLVRAGDGRVVALDQADAVLALDRLVVGLAPGESLTIAEQRITAEAESRALVSLSSEFLTVAVTHGRLRFGEGPTAEPGSVLLLALDGDRVQRLAFDAARLSSTLSPGARSILGADLEGLVGAQRRAAFWGTWQPLRVNARAQSPPAVEALRTAYLSDPAIIRQRRAAAGVASVEARAWLAAQAFLAAAREGDAATLAALLDPAPFLAQGGAAGVEEGRRRAAQSLLANPRLQPTLASAQIESVAADGSAALLVGNSGRWRLVVVPRDRALFVAALEPAP